MYIRKEIREFMKKMPKEMKLPKHWKKFVNENSKEYNLLIKHGREYECTNCGKYFYSEQVEGDGCWDICPFCGGQYDVRRSNLKHYFFLYDLALIDNVDNKIILRYFEIRRSYDYKIRRFRNSVVEYARIVPELNIELVNDRFLKYLSAEYIYHTKRIKKWRVFTGQYGLSKYYKALYLDEWNKKIIGTIYQYAPMQEAINYLALKEEKINFIELMKKASYASFELLMKAGLHKLALECPEKFNKKGNFEQRFGVGKEFYKFMVKHDISYKELQVLQLIKRGNIKLIRKILEISYYNTSNLKEINQYIDLVKLKDYSKNQEYFSIYSYLDYIRNMEKLGTPLTKKVLLPKNFRKAHDISVKKVKVVENKIIKEKIEQRYEQLEKNKHSDNLFLIRPAKSLNDMKDEAKQQNNCVYKNYSEPYADGKTDIYFMREIKNPNKSLVTVEVTNGKIRQKYQKLNQLVTKEQNKFLTIWEKEILKVA